MKIQANSTEIRVSNEGRRGILIRSTQISMGKRIMVAVVGAGIGSLVGLMVSFLGAGNWALIVGAVLGAVVPLLVLGQPSP
jgi:uncharacterized membrane protein YeaQ/YmgE (transglycosylase-associated protein family)